MTVGACRRAVTHVSRAPVRSDQEVERQFKTCTFLIRKSDVLYHTERSVSDGLVRILGIIVSAIERERERELLFVSLLTRKPTLLGGLAENRLL